MILQFIAVATLSLCVGWIARYYYAKERIQIPDTFCNVRTANIVNVRHQQIVEDRLMESFPFPERFQEYMDRQAAVGLAAELIKLGAVDHIEDTCQTMEDFVYDLHRTYHTYTLRAIKCFD